MCGALWRLNVYAKDSIYGHESFFDSCKYLKWMWWPRPYNNQIHLDSSDDAMKWSEIKASGRCSETEECQIEKGETWILDESMRLV